MATENKNAAVHRPIIALCIIASTTFLPVVLTAWLLSLSIRTNYGGICVVSPVKWLLSTSLPIFLSFRGLVKQSLSLSGAVAALFVGFFITIANYCFCTSLIIFYITSSRLTNFRAEQKKKQEEDYHIGGSRNWIQVLCNGGIPGVIAILYLLENGCNETTINFRQNNAYISSWLSLVVIGSLSCACGDTWASEIGSVLGDGTAILITKWKKVPAGTNGGITLAGTVASAAGGLVVGLTYYITTILTSYINSAQWPVILTGALCGLFGSLLDSLFGATLQFSGINEVTKKVASHPGPDVKRISGINLLDNHAVNFITCFITGLMTPPVFQIICYLFVP